MRQEEDETEADRFGTIGQVAIKRTILAESRELLEELLSGIQAAAANARKDQAQVVFNFEGQNEGVQIGVSYGAISAIYIWQEAIGRLILLYDYMYSLLPCGCQVFHVTMSGMSSRNNPTSSTR